MDCEGWSAARGLHREQVSDAQAKNFWARVSKSGDCWDFLGRLNPRGYGQVGIGTKAEPRSVLAHRLAYALGVGPVPARLYVLHACDRPSCVRPAHLSLGSHADNQRQKAERGRVNVVGERNPRARLTEELVTAMRVEYATLRRGQKLAYRMEMASRFGMSSGGVSAALLGQNWKSPAITEWVQRDGVAAVREACGV